MTSSAAQWDVVFLDFETLQRNLKALTARDFQAFIRILVPDLQLHGLDILATPSGKWLGDGLAEYRYRKSPSVLVRVFVAFPEGNLALILSGYDKLRHPAKSFQNSQIRNARKLLANYVKHRL